MSENISTDDTGEGEEDQRTSGTHVLISEVHDLQDRLDAVERALEADGSPGSTDDGASVEDLGTEIESVQSRIDRQERALAALRADVDELQASVHLILDLLASHHDTVSDRNGSEDA